MIDVVQRSQVMFNVQEEENDEISPMDRFVTTTTRRRNAIESVSLTPSQYDYNQMSRISNVTTHIIQTMDQNDQIMQVLETPIIAPSII